MSQQEIIGFADLAAERRINKSAFLQRLDQLIDWRPITNIIHKHYSKGKSEVGKPAYEGILLFKICLLQHFYGLSDYEAEERINDSLSFSKFLDLSIEHKSPDHSTICRFRNEMVEKKVFDKLFKALNKQLEKHKIIVKSGILIDASITNSPFLPKQKPNFELMPMDRKEDENPQENSDQQTEKQENPQENSENQTVIYQDIQEIESGDLEAAWLKKGKKAHFGYKKHVATDEQGLVLGIVTTPANKSDTKQFEAILNTLDLKNGDEMGSRIKADKGYKSAENDEILRTRKLKNGIMLKKPKGKKLSAWEDKFNKLISKTRYRIERTFGSIKSWFKSTKARYRGLEKTHAQHILEAIAYNLYRFPRIAMSIPVQK